MTEVFAMIGVAVCAAAVTGILFSLGVAVLDEWRMRRNLAYSKRCVCTCGGIGGYDAMCPKHRKPLP
ncbi:MAG: hypothetical protein V3S71_06500 [Acidobacteriota bacterium]